MNIDLRVRLGDLELKNPLIAGSGPLTHSYNNLKNAVEAGFGGIVTKTCTSTEYFRSYPRMEEYLLDFETKKDKVWYKPPYWSLYHRDHLQHQDPEAWCEILSRISKLCRENDCILIGSIEAEQDIAWWKKLAKMHEEAGCDALELNYCCPHPQVISEEYTTKTPVGAWTGKDPNLAANIVRELKKEVRIPCFPKLTPEAEDPSMIAAAVKGAGANGVTCLSRNLSLRIDIETGKAIGYSYCSSSGPGTKEFSLRWVAKIAQEVVMPIMGANGPVKWQDFIEFMMAGANAVQTCSAIMIYGYKYVGELLKEMTKFLNRKGYESAQEIVGLALPLGIGADIPKKFKAKYAVIDEENCTKCRRCLVVCYYSSLKAEKKRVLVEEDRCVGCGLCQWVCPYDVITYKERTNEEEYLRALRSEA
jgi:dihydroorotate dehydrogenase/NAD-dependent dihydropyrimidine dehydrogenase PreA subunit